MSAPLPRRPGSRPPGQGGPVPPVGALSRGGKTGSATASRNRATPLPMLLAGASVAIGLGGLFFAVDQGQSSSALSWGIFGYLLAGFAPPLLLGWDSASQRRGIKDPNFSARKGYGTALRAIVLVGIVAAVFHLITIADVLALRISEWLYVLGLMTP